MYVKYGLTRAGVAIHDHPVAGFRKTFLCCNLLCGDE
jgi:hypothetical protein